MVPRGGLIRRERISASAASPQDAAQGRVAQSSRSAPGVRVRHQHEDFQSDTFIINLIKTVQSEIDTLGVEIDDKGWWGKVYLYCTEIILCLEIEKVARLLNHSL